MRKQTFTDWPARLQSRWRKPDEDGTVRLVKFAFEGVERCEIEEWPEVIMLCKLNIFPMFQGRGLGSRVLSELKRLGKPIRLIPYPDNPERYSELVRFYERNGFVMPAGDDAMLWQP